MHFYNQAIAALKLAIAFSSINFLFYLQPVFSQEQHSSPSHAPTNRIESTPALTPSQSEAERLINQGLEKLCSQDYQGAMQNFKKAIALDPEHDSAYMHLGELSRHLGDHQAAINYFSKAIENHPLYAYLYVSRGNAYEALKNYKLAIEDYTQAIKIYPEDGIGYSHRGAAYYKLGNTQQALQDLQQAIKINPGRADAFLNRGHIYAQIGDINRGSEDNQQCGLFYKKAVTDYQQAAKLFDEQGQTSNSQKVKNVLEAFQQCIVPATK